MMYIVHEQLALESARQFAITTPYQATSGLAPPFKMESSTGDDCAFVTTFQQHDISHHHEQQQQQHREQFYMTSSSCNDVTDDQLMRQQMMMMMAYQYGGAHDVYNALPPGGARLRHDDTALAERSVNFTHPFSITNIMSARQRQQQQQLLHTAEFDDVKAAEFPAAGEPPPNDVTNYAYNQPRMMGPPCALLESYAGHVTDQKSVATTTPSLNGVDGYDAPHYGIVSTTTTNE